jgi:hypothetical protein
MLPRAIESYFDGDEFQSVILTHAAYDAGWLPISAVASLPRVKQALKLLHGSTDEARICIAIKTCKSQVVQLHKDETSVRKLPFQERLSRAISRLFRPQNFYCDLYLQLKAGEDGSVTAHDVLKHPELSFARMNTPGDVQNSMKALKSSIPFLHSAIVYSRPDGTPSKLKPKPLKQQLMTQLEFLFSEKNLLSDTAMKRLWQNAVRDNSGWVKLLDICQLPHVQDLAQPQLSVMADFLRTSRKLTVGQGSDDGHGGEEFFVRPNDYQDQAEEPVDEVDHLGEQLEHAGISDHDDVSGDDFGTTPPPKRKFFAGPDSDEESEDDEDDDEDDETDDDDKGHGGLWLPKPVTSPGHITVMSYNVLASMCATEDQFPYADPKVLLWKNRFPRLVEQIVSVKPSVVCLQEMQVTGATSDTPPASRHFLHMKKLLAGHGYDGIAMKKTSKDGIDLGNAVLWQTAEFDLVEKHRVAFSDELCLSALTF